MKPRFFVCLLASVAFLGLAAVRGGEGLDAALQAKVDTKLKDIQAWAASEPVLKAVREHNTSLPAEQGAMTQDRWKGLTVLDPFVRGFTKNEVAGYLKERRTEEIAEAFLSGADGLKVAFLAKPSNWCHKGKAKHDVPMTGKPWQGPVEVDESSGLQQVQVAVPVLDGGKPIGSLVVGLSVAKLK